ncbi:hypothetical protein VCR17J2_390104 [Vibrio coralliirubri]|nr:hypothetical protein VCR1J2_20351 [Vibrio coralliirubri]CDT85262.1 hypothetical protein VCR8J2_240355 [Vibrio coralliirubri]CDU12825.1 hypothetical protein VCR17J2_390104 [Vibrio coralliirubri]
MLHKTNGKNPASEYQLVRITKHGDKYLRTLLVHGARTVIANLGDKQDKLSQWCRGVLERRGMK